MALKGVNGIATGTTAVVISFPSAAILPVHRSKAVHISITNSGAVTVRVGGSDVTAAANGRTIAAGATIDFDLDHGSDVVWAASASASTVDVLQTGV